MRTPRRAVMASFVLNGALFGAWASRIPAITEKHALTAGDFGLLLLVMGVGAILSFPLAGRASDTIGASKATRYVAFAYLTSLTFLGLAPNPLTLAMALFFFGATHGAMDVVMNAWAGEVEEYLKKPIMASFHGLWSLGTGVGAASGFFAVQVAMAPLLHFVLFSLVITSMLWWVWIDWQRPTKPAVQDSPIFALPKGVLLLVGLFALCSAVIEGGAADWGALMLIETTAVSEAKAALGFAVFSVAMVTMRLSGDRITARFGSVGVASVSGVVAAIGACLVVFGPNYTVALVGFGLMALGVAMIFPLAYSRAARDPDVPSGAAIASVATMGYGGLLVGPPVLGGIAELTSLQMSFGILIVLALLSSVLAGSLRTKPVG
ncbi:MFS transporter [Actibacterium pelagium]|uniref:Transporter y4wD n=1 Tax=Actibacterium pelagium TaxID=2029103 RepID=A0A917ABP7_9RHOB|nr:MFS transporter [Actibacterium pelagium]GGE40893.1 putative transporter y4wD [Actibacterium pelagium]